MMIRVALMRHAKSDWGNPQQNDKERCINGRGREACVTMAKALDENGYKPSLTLCSAATRAVETYEHLSAVWDDAPEASFHDVLYLAPSYVLEQAVSTYAARLDDTNSSLLLVVGHNPGLEELAADWCKAISKETGGKTKVGHFPTAACAVFEGEMEGRDFVPTKLLSFLSPKAL